MSNIDKPRMRRAFERAATQYDDIAVLQQEVGSRVMERLDYLTMVPDRILDVGAGTGRLAHALDRKYKHAQVVALDIALPMLQQAKKHNGWFRKIDLLVGDAESLPLSDDTFNMIFSNLALQWCQNLPKTFEAWWRVMQPNGVLMFTTLGPNTLHELRESWRAVDNHVHVNTFVDMHDIGDILSQAGFVDPVMDVDTITMRYPDLKALLKSLKGIGAHNVLHDQHRGLTGKTQFQQLRAAYENFRVEGLLPATYEVVYGHAWMPQQKSLNRVAEAYIPLDAVRAR